MADEVTWRPTLRRKSPFGKPFRPFSPFARIREQQPNHLEVERFEVFGPTRVEDAWLRRRRHAPLDLHVPAAWNLDAIYLRHAEELKKAEIMRDLLLERVSRLEEEARGASTHYGPDSKCPRY